METSTKSAIRADNIVKSFGKKKVLGGVSFNIRAFGSIWSGQDYSN